MLVLRCLLNAVLFLFKATPGIPPGNNQSLLLTPSNTIPMGAQPASGKRRKGPVPLATGESETVNPLGRSSVHQPGSTVTGMTTVGDQLLATPVAPVVTPKGRPPKRGRGPAQGSGAGVGPDVDQLGMPAHHQGISLPKNLKSFYVPCKLCEVRDFIKLSLIPLLSLIGVF